MCTKPARLWVPAKPGRDSQRTRLERLRLPLWRGSNGLVDLPKIAFGIGKVRCAQFPGLVGWGSDKRDALSFEFLVCGIDIRNTSSQKPAWPSLDLQLIDLRT